MGRFKLRRITALLALVVSLVVGLRESCEEEEEEESPKGQPAALRAPGYVLVDFEDGIDAATVDAREQGTGVDLSLNSEVGSGIALGSLGDPSDDAEQLGRLRAMDGVESVEPLYLYQASRHVDDPEFALQWHLAQIHAPAAWDLADGSGVVVAVVDTGIAYAEVSGHVRAPDLAGTRFVDGYDFVDDDTSPHDLHGHGTHVAGTIAQSTHNAFGVAGVAYGAALMPLRVLDGQGRGNSADIADAIRFAADHGARVVNLSLGGGGRSEAMERAVKYARRRGVVVVAAAGNAARPVVEFPAAYPGVLGVSAVRFDRTLAPYSSWGPQVDLAAPGGDKSVDQNGDGLPDGVLQNTLVRGDPRRTAFEWYQGTSMAAPHVAGTAALLFSVGGGAREVEAALTRSAVELGAPGRDPRFGYGLLDARAAIVELLVHRGIVRSLVAGLVVLVALASIPRRRPRVSFRLAAGAIACAAGLFPLAYLAGHVPGIGALVSPLFDPTARGLGAIGPLLLSPLPIFVVAFVTFGSARTRTIAAGMALGQAALLLMLAFGARPAALPLVGSGLVAALLLIGSAIVCFVMGRALWAKEVA